MEEQRIDRAASALGFLEDVIDAVLPSYSDDQRRDVVTAFRDTLLADRRLHVRARLVGSTEWQHGWATGSRRVVVGRSPSCDIQFTRSQRLSEFHFELEHIGSRVAVRDLGSTLGTTLRGESLDPFIPKRLEEEEVLVVAGELEFAILRQPHSNAAYGKTVVRLTSKQSRLVEVMRKLHREGRSISPTSLADELSDEPGFSVSNISNPQMMPAIRDKFWVPYDIMRHDAYMEIVRKADAVHIEIEE